MRPRQPLAVERHPGMDLGERPAKFLMQPPAAGKAQHCGGQARSIRRRLDQAQILLQQTPGELERVVRRDIPVLAAQAIADCHVVLFEPVRVNPGQVFDDHRQRFGARGFRTRFRPEHLRVALGQQAVTFRDLRRITRVDFEPFRFGRGHESHGHSIRSGFERQVDRFWR